MTRGSETAKCCAAENFLTLASFTAATSGIHVYSIEKVRLG